MKRQGVGLSLSEGVTNKEMSERKSVGRQSGQGCLMGWKVGITACNAKLSSGFLETLWLVTLFKMVDIVTR